MITTEYTYVGTVDMIDAIFNSVLEDIGIVDEHTKITADAAKIGYSITEAIDTYLIYDEDILGLATDGLIDINLRGGVIEFINADELESVVFSLIDNDYLVTVS